MSDMAQIDRNFAVKGNLDKDNIRFYSVDEPPFRIYGVFKENGQYRRMPREVAQQVSKSVLILHSKTSGGRVRFRTDSGYVAIKAEMQGLVRSASMNPIAAKGFDLYKDGVFAESFIPPVDIEDGYESVIELGDRREREITIHFPLFAGVKELYIGLEENACVKEAAPYQGGAPIVCYGSSITQGCCASRPGMSYQNILARRLNRDFFCLGFSGNALAEDEIIEYVKGLDMSVFIYDYDNNAPSVEYLRNTHEKMFRAIRQEKPNLPILILPRPKYTLTDEEKGRYDIIRQTYGNALAAGDKNVYLVDGPTLMALCKEDGLLDDGHPTDFGFASMAKAIGDVLEQILQE